MKKRCIHLTLLCLLTTVQLVATNYGLHFNSHSSPASQRTSLWLNNGNPFAFNKEFTIRFLITLRQEPIFGNIFCIQTNDGQTISAVFSNNGNTNMPALIVNERIYPMEHLNITPEHFETEVLLKICKKDGYLAFNFLGKEITAPVKLEQTNSLQITFGKRPQQQDHIDVAPINLRDVKVDIDGKPVYHWELKQHNDSICYDLLQGIPAVAHNPHWLMDDHVEWKHIYSFHSNDHIQTAFNPNENLFYIVNNNKIVTFCATDGKQDTIKVKGGYRAMMYSNHVTYIPQNQTLLSYSLSKRRISIFDFNTCHWNLETQEEDEPFFSNHSYCTNDSIAYFWGGYGFYHYKNTLHRMNLKDYSIEKCNYQPKISPRCASASALVGNKLYIFGGFGNNSGKQELPCTYYYDLQVINLETMTSQKIWSVDSVKNNFLMASTMYFNSQDSSFYAASTEYGGMLIKISLNEPRWKYVSKSIFKHLIFKDFTFEFYQASKFDRMYLVLNKQMNDGAHHVEIYSIECPLYDDNVTQQSHFLDSVPSNIHTINWCLSVAAIAIFIFFLLRWKYKRGEEKCSEYPNVEMQCDTGTDSYLQTESMKKESYLPPKSSIYILGKFCVIDKEGNDITTLFTPRTKSLLVLLLLYSEKNEKGIVLKKVDELIWNDKDKEAARNNRNVYISKLKILLARVGNITILNDKMHYRIQLGDDIFFDYHEVISQITTEEVENLTKEKLELLLKGALLPDSDSEWLDDFKSDYSNRALYFLVHMLNIEMAKGNDDLAQNIAEAIFSHDTLNEEALSAQCFILNKKGITGIAKGVYDKFCREYQKCMNEQYSKTFYDVCNNVKYFSHTQ